MSDLNRRVRASVRVTMAGTLANGVVQAATMVVLARLLGPADYGFFVVALSINALSCAFVASAVERAMVLERDERAMWGRSPVVALLLAGIAAVTLGIAAGVSALTGWQVQLGVLTLVLGSQGVMGLAVPVRAWLRRELRFVPLVLSDLGGLFFGNFLTAGFAAYLGMGAYSLGLAFGVQAVLTTGWILWQAPAGMLRPRWTGWGDLPRTAWGVLKPATLEAANGQISPLVVSSLLGAVQLGLFSRVYNLVTLPVQLLVSSVNRVLISALASVAHDPDRLRRAARLIIRMASALITPLAFGLAGSGGTFVAVVLGPRWAAATQIVPLLAVAIWGNMLGSLLGQLAEAARRFDSKARIQAVCTASLVALLVAGGLGWGLPGVAAGAMVAALIFAGCYLALTVAILEVPVRAVFVWLLPGLAAGAGCFAIAHLTGRLLAGYTPAGVLAAQVLGCGLMSVLAIAVLDRTLLVEISASILPARIGAVLARRLAPRAPLKRGI